MNCLFGVDKRAGGEIRLNGKDISPRSPLDAVKKGMAYITESRRDNGFFPNFSIAQNMAISRSLKDGGYKRRDGGCFMKLTSNVPLKPSANCWR